MFVLLIVHTTLCQPESQRETRFSFGGAAPVFEIAGIPLATGSTALRFAYTRSIAGDLFSCRNRRLIVTHYEIYFVQQMQKV